MPRLDDVISQTDVNDTTVLTTYSDRRLARGAVPLCIPSITVDPSLEPVLGSYNAGDIVTVRSGILEVKDKALHLLHEMINDETGELAATTVVIGVCIDANLRKAGSLPTDVQEQALKRLIGNESAGSENSQFPQSLRGDNLRYHGDTEPTESRLLHLI